MKITKKLAYGVNENTPSELLYVKRIILRDYKTQGKNNKTFMGMMSNFSNFKIFQYNYDKAQDSDYFKWQYVNNKGEEDWTHIDLSTYQDNLEGVYMMRKLLEICENTYIDIDVEVQYDDIRNLIKKVEEIK